MTDFESLPDLPAPAENQPQSELEGSVPFNNAPFPTAEESASVNENGNKANQAAWLIVIGAIVLACLCCFLLLLFFLIAGQGNTIFLSEALHPLVVVPLRTLL